MKIQELKVLVLKNKKVNKERSLALAAVLKHVENKTVGVQWNPKDEEKIVLQSFKKELKEQLQSKEMNAPYSEVTISICEQVIAEQSPKVLSEEETRKKIFETLIKNPGFQMGQIMGSLKKEFGASIDMALASKLTKKMLDNIKFDPDI